MVGDERLELRPLVYRQKGLIFDEEFMLLAQCLTG